MTEEAKPEQWDGSERRGLPMHILRYIDERMEENYHAFDSRLAAFDDRFESLGDRMASLTQSINSWMEKEPAAIIVQCEKLIDEAIPVHPEYPSATPAEKRHEHRKAHASWIRKVDEEMKRWAVIRQELVKWVILGSMSIVAIAVWQYLLQGPR